MDSQRPKTDLATFGRRIVTIIDAEMGEADRIQNAAVTISLLADETTFGPVQQWKTQYQTVNFGTLTFEQNRELSADAEIAPGSPRIDAVNIAGKINNTLSENVALTRDIPRLTINRTSQKNELLLRHKGGLGLSLAGATAVDTAVVVPRATKFLAFARTAPLAEPRITILNVAYPRSACSDVRAQVKLDATVRRVSSGSDTYTESDDEVVFTAASASTNVLLVSRAELDFVSWSVVTDDGDPLQILDSVSDQSDLEFARRSDADEVLQWQRTTTQATIDSLKLYAGGQPVELSSLRTVRLRATRLNGCKEGELTRFEQDLEKQQRDAADTGLKTLDLTTRELSLQDLIGAPKAAEPKPDKP